MKSASQDNTTLIGELSIYTCSNDKRTLFFKEKNLITKAARNFILSGLYTPGIVSDPISTLHIGAGGTIDPEGFFPKPENTMQTGLITPLLTLPASSSSDLSQVSVTFIAEVDQTQLNGSLISEAGLFKTSGEIFNIKNHPGIPKSASFSIHYEWRILIP